MVRNCIVDLCRESDLTILTHRFPKSIEATEKWRNALGLKDYTIDELQRRYVVCTRHFSANSYRNATSVCINSNAVPNRDVNEDNARIHQKKVRSSSPPSKKVKVLHKNDVVILNGASKPLNATRIELKNVLAKYKKLAPNTTVSQSSQRQKLGFRVVGDHENLAVEESPLVPYEEVEVIDENYCQFENNLETTEVYPENYETEEYGESVIREEFDQAETTRQLVETIDNATQTEERDDACSNISSEAGHESKDSKDDKLITILYPEFAGLSKMKLVEMLNERDEKVKSMEEKILKLQAAMRDLI